jgi:arginine decarboxylase
MNEETQTPWSVEDASQLYDVPRWGKKYFSVDASGDLLVHPESNQNQSINIKEVVDGLRLRGVELPVLLRFDGILKHRLQELRDAFATAIADHDYQGKYSCVYPIKTNQARHVVERIVQYGREFGFGLEAGSKPELLAILALADAEMPVVCNGFKDASFIKMALLAQKMGHTVIPVVESYSEFELILEYSEQLGIRPMLGMRVKLAAQGAGRWHESGGIQSKFGLTISEILRAFESLQARQMEDCFQLLHFHLGSQISDIRSVKSALIEAARVYAGLHNQGAGLNYLDIGGGLGVDYEGSRSNADCSMNYSLQEYANDVVFHINNVCEDANVPHPNIISESGRAISAYNSVLVFNAFGTSGPGVRAGLPEALVDDAEQPLRTLWDTYHALQVENVLKSFHDAQLALEMAINLFNSGHLPLQQRSLAEDLFRAICASIRELASHLEVPSEELSQLDQIMRDIYFCNFSLFQSLPDSWAVNQLFPIMPIHRLNERPTRNAILGDITCDSDGKIDHFVGPEEVNRTLPLHVLNDEPYYLAAFLVGAYQEILGDLHNLFGDTNVAHVDVSESGEFTFTAIVKGDKVNDVLDYVQYDVKNLLDRVQATVEAAVRAGRLGHSEAGAFLKFYEESLNSYTYLQTTVG